MTLTRRACDSDWTKMTRAHHWYLHLLFEVLFCARPIFRNEITIHSLIFSFVLLLNLINFFIFVLGSNIFLTTLDSLN